MIGKTLDWMKVDFISFYCLAHLIPNLCQDRIQRILFEDWQGITKSIWPGGLNNVLVCYIYLLHTLHVHVTTSIRKFDRNLQVLCNVVVCFSTGMLSIMISPCHFGLFSISTLISITVYISVFYLLYY